MKRVGIPANARTVRALPDTEPVEFPSTRAVRMGWITDEMVRELEEEGPA